MSKILVFVMLRGLIARHSCEPGDLVMCVQPAAVVTGEADNQPDPEFLVPALLEAARQPQVLAALSHLYDGTGVYAAAVPAAAAGTCWLLSCSALATVHVKLEGKRRAQAQEVDVKEEIVCMTTLQKA
jgi:hypothetical protein